MSEELIYLEACLPEANLFRYFSIRYGPNLFGDLQMTVINGRIGSRLGGWRSMIFKDEASFYKKLGQLLRKRLHAENRIGCNYVIKQSTVDAAVIEDLIKPKRKSASVSLKAMNG
jgi:hypothetical protein